jgi:hypothetical protein
MAIYLWWAHCFHGVSNRADEQQATSRMSRAEPRPPPIPEAPEETEETFLPYVSTARLISK